MSAKSDEAWEFFLLLTQKNNYSSYSYCVPCTSDILGLLLERGAPRDGLHADEFLPLLHRFGDEGEVFLIVGDDDVFQGAGAFQRLF